MNTSGIPLYQSYKGTTLIRGGMTLNQFIYKGWWWLPDDKESQKNPIAGHLSFSSEQGLQLELMGTLGGDKGIIRQLPNDLPKFALLCGQISGKHQKVTLLDCQTAHAQINFFDPGKSTFTMRCSFAYIGNAWLSERDEKFKQVQISCSYLLDWVGRVGFEVEMKEVDNKISSYNIAYGFPESYVALAAESHFTINYALNQNFLGKNVNLEERVSLDIECPNAMSMGEWLSQYANPIQNLLSLAIDKPVSLTNLTVISEINKKLDEESQLVALNDTDQPIKMPLQVVFKQVSHVEETEQLRSENILFFLKDIEISLDRLLDLWLTFHKDYSVVCNLFFSTRRRPQPYLSGRFLVVAQAAEIFHRIKFPATAFPAEEFKKRKKAIVQSTPDEYREWLKQQLAWSNELSLKQRIQKLYEYTASVTHLLIINPEAFIVRVRDTRNYYTHYSSTLRQKAADHEELHWLTEVLRYMLTACLLYEIGFSVKKVEELFKRNESFQFACRELSSLRKDW